MGTFGLSLGAILVLMLVGMPVAWALGFVSLVTFILEGFPLQSLPHLMVSGINVFVLMAVPLFVLTGKLMNASGLTANIFAFAEGFVGTVRGGLAYVVIIASVIFAGISGAAVADVQGLGTVVLKDMERGGYKRGFSAAVVIAGSTLAPIIPPSITFVVYAVLAGVSVGDMFLAGFIPGFLLAGCLMAYVAVSARRLDLPVSRKVSFKEFRRNALLAIPALVVPIILVSSLVFGLATPTEIGVISTLYLLCVLTVLWRPSTIHEVWQCLRETAESTAAIMIIVGAAVLYGKVLTLEQVPIQLAALVTTYTQTPLIFLVVVNAVCLLLGCFLDGLAILLVMMPVLLPAMKTLQVDPIHFGVMITLNLMIGQLTPPFGMSLFAMSSISKIPSMVLAREASPFLLPISLALVIITLFPSVVTFLPYALR